MLDICNAHKKAITFLRKKKNTSNIFNLGSKEGISSLQIIKHFENIFKINLIILLKQKRGEPDKLISDINKSKKLLNWKSTKSHHQIIKDTFIWQKKFEKLKKK